jgi:glycosyltransferase involved in cell wall biosynthesis
MKILSFQPFPLYANSGGSRVLRRFYEDHEKDITSLVVLSNLNNYKQGIIREIIIPAFPTWQWWMRWRLRSYSTWLRHNVFYNRTVAHIQEAASSVSYDAIHIVNHGPFSCAICEESFLSGKSLWVSFHDHFSTVESSIDDTKKLWNIADRRLVISQELGQEYQRLFGRKDFEIITDGVLANELSSPIGSNTSSLTIYFVGLLHIEYLPLFAVLADALDLLVKQGFTINLILRGTSAISFLQNRSFTVEYRNNFISDEELKIELDSAQILYLPIKFSIPDFYLYSLSTKMVSYLGASGAILYHGPDDSAACHLLQDSEAAAICTTLEADDLIKTVLSLQSQNIELSLKAKELARSKFNFCTLKKQFWQEN